MSHGYVVESAAINSSGEHVGTFRHYVATEARAQEECAKAPGRTYRAVPLNEMPEAARVGIARVLGL